MNYFEVYVSEATPMTITKVYADGTVIPETEDCVGNEIIEYIVYEYEEDGTMIGTQHYVIGGGTDEEEAMENIKRDHPADEWQNHDW